MTQTYSEKENPSAPIRSRTKDLPITKFGRYTAEATGDSWELKPGSHLCDKHKHKYKHENNRVGTGMK